MNHYYSQDGDIVVVVGYNTWNNQCILQNLWNLHKKDQERFMEVIESPEAQNTEYLIPTLLNNMYDDNQTWWSFLMEMGSLYSVDLNKISDKLSSKQIECFRRDYEKEK